MNPPRLRYENKFDTAYGLHIYEDFVLFVYLA